MRPKGFAWLLIPWVERYDSLAFHRIDNEVIDLSDIVGGISDKECAFFEFEKPFEFFDELYSYLGIGGVVWQGLRNERDSFFRYNDMGTIAPKEDKVVFFPLNFLIGIVTERGLMISFWKFFLVMSIALGILEVVFSGGSHNGF